MTIEEIKQWRENARWDYWFREFNKSIPIKTSRYYGVLIREMEGKDMISYLRHAERIGAFAGKSQFLRNAVGRKLKQYKGVEWDNFGLPINIPKKPFNYWKKLFPSIYL